MAQPSSMSSSIIGVVGRRQYSGVAQWQLSSSMTDM